MKLYLLLLGAAVPGRNVEQHDYFFGIAGSIGELVPAIKAFWPEAGNSLHIDGWRAVTRVGNCAIAIALQSEEAPVSPNKLFFLNLGGYSSGILEEQHYTLLTVQDNRSLAIQAAKKNIFFKSNSLKGIATSHIDEKYGLDVDDIHQIEDLLPPVVKKLYKITITEGTDLPEDTIHLGYFKLDKLK